MTQKTKNLQVSSQKKAGNRPNLEPFLPEGIEVILFDSKTQKTKEPIPLSAWSPGVNDGLIWFNKWDAQQPPNVDPVKQPVDSISPQSFIEAVRNRLVHPNESGFVPFYFPDGADYVSIAREMFVVLWKCTEGKRNGRVREYSQAAKELVARRFELLNEAQVKAKCNELYEIRIANMVTYVDEFLHFPGLQGFEMEEYNTPSETIGGREEKKFLVG